MILLIVINPVVSSNNRYIDPPELYILPLNTQSSNVKSYDKLNEIPTTLLATALIYNSEYILLIITPSGNV